MMTPWQSASSYALPPICSRRSMTITLWPALASCSATTDPAKPAPTTRTSARDIGHVQPGSPIDWIAVALPHSHEEAPCVAPVVSTPVQQGGDGQQRLFS